MNNKNSDNQNPLDFKELEHLKRQMTAAHTYNEQNIIVSCVDVKGSHTLDEKLSQSRHATSLKFVHIVFYERTHTGGAIRRLSEAPSNNSKQCKNMARRSSVLLVRCATGFINL